MRKPFLTHGFYNYYKVFQNNGLKIGYNHQIITYSQKITADGLGDRNGFNLIINRNVPLIKIFNN
jgi:hypothetical protein